MESRAGDGKEAGVTRALALALFVALGALPAFAQAPNKANAPVPADTQALMAKKDMAATAPVLLRTFKKEAVLEVWKQTRAGRYVLLKSFPVCRWSGQLGPKRKTGDRQTPEGFYPVAAKQLNPNSHYYLSFDVGFPNAYDKAQGASGAYLMVHGTCSSAGCYAMTDKQVGEIYALVRDALAAGQSAFQFQAFPFRMTAENLAKHRSDQNLDFWRQLKDGSDRFEATGEEPKVSVVAGRYAFSGRTPQSEAQGAARAASEKARIDAFVTDGIASIRTTYSDGGQHAIFAAMLKKGDNLGDVSRPEALAYAGKEVVLVPARKAQPKPVEVATTRAIVDDISRDLAGVPITGAWPMLSGGLAPSQTTLVAALVKVKPANAPANVTTSGNLRPAL